VLGLLPPTHPKDIALEGVSSEEQTRTRRNNRHYQTKHPPKCSSGFLVSTCAPSYVRRRPQSISVAGSTFVSVHAQPTLLSPSCSFLPFQETSILARALQQRFLQSKPFRLKTYRTRPPPLMDPRRRRQLLRRKSPTDHRSFRTCIAPLLRLLLLPTITTSFALFWTRHPHPIRVTSSLN
jgi:hypothetical protein